MPIPDPHRVTHILFLACVEQNAEVVVLTTSFEIEVVDMELLQNKQFLYT
jgi:hypothetical protein